MHEGESSLEESLLETQWWHVLTIREDFFFSKPNHIFLNLIKYLCCVNLMVILWLLNLTKLLCWASQSACGAWTKPKCKEKKSIHPSAALSSSSWRTLRCSQASRVRSLLRGLTRLEVPSPPRGDIPERSWSDAPNHLNLSTPPFGGTSFWLLVSAIR